MTRKRVRTSRPPADSPFAQISDTATYRPRVVVKFHDWIDIPYELGAERVIQERQLGDWTTLLSQFPGLTLTPRFTAVPSARLRTLVDRGRELDRSYEPSNVFTYFAIESPPGVRADAIAAALNEWPTVQVAYVESGPSPPPLAITPNDDPRFANQGYLKKAPDGIDAEYAWTFTGGDGAGVHVIDIEHGWMLTHEDLIAAQVQLIAGKNATAFAHGTSTLGVLIATDNQKGGLGVAPHASARVVSEFDAQGVPNRANQILMAIDALTFGDVLLLEMQAEKKLGNSTLLLPAEIENAVFDVIRLATALGIAVVEPSGNGGLPLNAMADAKGKHVLDTGSNDFKDSGAIMVGAATSSVPHRPKQFSNNGPRVNCYSWGENVDTCSTNTTATTSDYTTTFDGTSSASAIIAGAALVVQGLALAALKRPFSAWQLRAILADTTVGTAAENAPEVMIGDPGIGVMPNLKAILSQKLKIAPDVYLRDFVGDTGDPHKGAINASPDIIVVPDKVADGNKAFGAGSGTENSDTLGSVVTPNKDNVVYVRVLNRGSAASANVMAAVYYAPVATLVAPTLWTPVGSVTIPSVAGGDVLTVSDAITWPAAKLPAAGHYCFVGIIGNADDPAPVPPDFFDWNKFFRLIRDNNNITWRNFHVIGMPPKPPSNELELTFLAPGAPEVSRVFGLEVVARLSEGAQAWLEMPIYLMQSLGLASPFVRLDARRGVALVSLNTRGCTPLGETTFGANSMAQLALRVTIPERLQTEEQQLHVSQLHQGVEVGRVTWRLMPSSRSAWPASENSRPRLKGRRKR